MLTRLIRRAFSCCWTSEARDRMAQLRPVFYISDGTGITAETIGHSLLTQFTDTQFIGERISFVDSIERAREAAERIRTAAEIHSARPIVINSCMDADVSETLA